MAAWDKKMQRRPFPLCVPYRCTMCVEQFGWRTWLHPLATTYRGLGLRKLAHAWIIMFDMSCQSLIVNSIVLLI